ncbi:hypothetical protein EJ05DRAFT_517198 [Pseudovirgaria hyperparasitica]|uniref:Uncharacterized protein n=1 Tax=Pseudovirgaria hyperparasitica TaxID=470096 RepID=A0A6A6W4L1_9PEZI|nr:uncharacterized protein EJ05DRAFT_517198 [Pseudovirgaria hyperparasitica]KAF2756850.1 hypothetical protein EJ05DRAFT_517198 [Pseudovirgaria hyperparasitica]
MSFSYDRYDRRRRNQPPTRRTTLGYWVPLLITATLAAGGLAAWVWSARNNDDSSDDDTNTDLSYGDPYTDARARNSNKNKDNNSTTYAQSQGVLGGETDARHGADMPGAYPPDDAGFMARMSHTIRRTPSPQQAFDLARRNVVAGVAAAGAMVGGALQSIREEEGRDDFGDHARWSEESVQRSATGGVVDAGAFAEGVRGAGAGAGAGGKKRKTVAVVLSAESALEELHDAGDHFSENASILSHLPPSARSTNLLILIYMPATPKSRRSSLHAASLGSSYSAISTPAAHTPGDDLTTLDPRPEYTPGTTPALSATQPPDSTPALRDIHAQALRLVDSDSCVMPFNTPSGFVHMLRHLAPDLVYLTDSLAGDAGENVALLRDWVAQIVVVVGAAGGGLGGLIDTEDDDDEESDAVVAGGGRGADTGLGKGRGKGRESAAGGGGTGSAKWWQSSDMVGLGKRVEVVEGVRMEEDFERRVGGRD